MYDVLEVCRHIIKYCDEKDYIISNLKLQKLLYFIQAYFLVVKNKPCFREPIVAWDIGPVVPAAGHEYRKYGGCHIWYHETYWIHLDDPWSARCVTFYDRIISPEDKRLIDCVVDRFADYSAVELTRITQHQTPWINAYEPDVSNEITTSSIKEYFTEAEANKKISASLTEELINYTKAQKWNGSLPTVTGGNSMSMLDFKIDEQ